MQHLERRPSLACPSAVPGTWFAILNYFHFVSKLRLLCSSRRRNLARLNRRVARWQCDVSQRRLNGNEQVGFLVTHVRSDGAKVARAVTAQAT